MGEIVTLLTAIIFYFIGLYGRREVVERKITEVKRAVGHKNRPKPGVLPFKTPEQIADEKSGDKALDEEWNRSGKRKIFS